jgi:hypothetical protein
MLVGNTLQLICSEHQSQKPSDPLPKVEGRLEKRSEIMEYESVRGTLITNAKILGFAMRGRFQEKLNSTGRTRPTEFLSRVSEALLVRSKTS